METKRENRGSDAPKSPDKETVRSPQTEQETSGTAEQSWRAARGVTAGPEFNDHGDRAYDKREEIQQWRDQNDGLDITLAED